MELKYLNRNRNKTCGTIHLSIAYFDRLMYFVLERQFLVFKTKRYSEEDQMRILRGITGRSLRIKERIEEIRIFEVKGIPYLIREFK